MPARSRWAAAHEWRSRNDGRVRGPAGEDDIGSGVQRVGEGLVAHQANDVFTSTRRRLFERSARFERRDPIVGQSLDEIIGLDLAVETRHGEAPAIKTSIDVDRPTSNDLGGG